MGTFKIKRGINLPIIGKPRQEITSGCNVSRVALLGEDYVGMKPTMQVEVGDVVKTGQLLFTDKKMPSIKYTSPGSGKVVEINRGEKRAFLSLVIELDGQDAIDFSSFNAADLGDLETDKVKNQLLDSGLWTCLRARPFGKVADPETAPHSIFVTAMDSNPLAPVVEKVLEGKETDFKNGLTVLTRLTKGKVFVCKYPNETIPVIENEKVSVESFKGPHPAGLAGTHIHFLDPVGRNKTVWYVNAQDVARIGVLFTTGKLDLEQIVALGGSGVKGPRLVKTRLGASLYDLLENELAGDGNRIISGSVFEGIAATKETGYLGRFHQQVTVIAENSERQFFGWVDFGPKHYSVKNVALSKLVPGKKFGFHTSSYGAERAIVPVGSYEKMMPLDIMITYLLRAIAVEDVEESEKLGCLELVEEDLALCTFVCPSKIDHGVNLRKTLTTIEKEG